MVGLAVERTGKSMSTELTEWQRCYDQGRMDLSDELMEWIKDNREGDHIDPEDVMAAITQLCGDY